MINEVWALLGKEIRLEWRQRAALNGMLLYVVSTIFVCYLSFRTKNNQLQPIVWNTLFWIILLFVAFNSVAKSFSQERYGRIVYYYTLTSAEGIIISKMLYNTLLMMLLSGMGLVFYTFVMGNPVQDFLMYLETILLGALGFAGSLTMVAGIASKAENSSTLMAILGFPVVLPMLLMLIKLSKNAIDGIDRGQSFDEIMTLLAINAIVWVLSVILFPYLWRS